MDHLKEIYSLIVEYFEQIEFFLKRKIQFIPIFRASTYFFYIKLQLMSVIHNVIVSVSYLTVQLLFFG